MNHRLTTAFLIISLFLLACKQKESAPQTLSYVDPLIGTGFHGHTFPGPVLPHGRIQLSPDTHIMGWDASSGYHYDDSTLYGFSHTHLSGTGIGDLGDILMLPFNGKMGLEKPVGMLDHTQEVAQPGYYSLKVLPWNIQAELTVAAWKGIHRYSYPPHEHPGLMLDLSHVLQPNWGHRLVSSKFKQIDAHTIEGFRFTSGWAKDDPIWFRSKFSKAIQRIDILNEDQLLEGSNFAKGQNITAYLYFEENLDTLIVETALSAVDRKGAEINLTASGAPLSFDAYVKHAETKWEEELAGINITTSDPDILKNFYTALYHSKIAPMRYRDADGRFRGLDRNIHQTNGKESYTVYSLWDVFRSWYPLMTLIEPNRARTWAYDLYDQGEKGGLLPKWALNGNYTGTMVGYPAVAILADASVKGMLDSIPDKLVKAAVKASSWQPAFQAKHKGTRAERVMTDHIYYKEKLGFVPGDSTNASVSYGLEMAYYDWCVARLAELSNQSQLAERYYQKGKAYQHYFDSEVGFMRAKFYDGSRAKDFHPSYSDHEKSDYIEGNAWQWSPFVLHDVEGFRDLLGGKKALGVWLDSLFSTSSEILGENASADISGLIGQYAHGNEPSHHVPFMYQYSDRPWRTQEILDHILYEFYAAEPAGIIGNEDCGQMSAWYVLNALGIYQMTPGRPEFFIGRPIVEEASIRLVQREFKIKVHNNSKENKYVQKVILNGEELESRSLEYGELMQPGLLEIFMGRNPVEGQMRSLPTLNSSL